MEPHFGKKKVSYKGFNNILPMNKMTDDKSDMDKDATLKEIEVKIIKSSMLANRRWFPCHNGKSELFQTWVGPESPFFQIGQGF